MEANTFQAWVVVLSALLLFPQIRAGATISPASPAKDSSDSSSWYTVPGPNPIPGINGIVKYSFTIDNTGGVLVDTADEIHITIGGAPAYTPASLTCVRADNANLIVNEAASTSNAVVTAFAVGDTATCSFLATVDATAQSAGAMPAYTVTVGMTDNTNSGTPVPMGSTTLSVVKVYTGSTLGATAAVRTADPNYVTVGGVNVPKSNAYYTYTITLTNGAKLLTALSPQYLKVVLGSPFASSPVTCSTPIGASNQLTANLVASGNVTCTFDVLVTPYAANGEVPTFDVTASWVIADRSTLVDPALIIPTYTVPAKPVYSGNALAATVPSAVDTIDPTKYIVEGNTNVVKETGIVKYTVTLTNGAKAIPTSATLDFTAVESSVTFASKACKDSNGAAIPTGTPITTAGLLTAGLIITCELRVTVSTAHRTAGAIPPFNIQATYGAVTGNDIQALYVPAVTTSSVPVYTGNALSVPSVAIVKTDTTKYITVGTDEVVKETGTVRYTVTLTNGAKSMPINSILSVTTPGVTSAKVCSTTLSGAPAPTTITLDSAITNTDLLASALVINCTLDVTVTATHKNNGVIPSFTVQAAYSGSLITGANVQAMYIPAVTAPPVAVYTGNTLALTAQQVVTSDPTKFINVDGINWARQGGQVRYTVTLTNGAKNIPSPAVLDFSSSSGLTFAAKSCSALIGGTDTAIPVGVNIATANQLAAGLRITCTLDLNVTADQKTAGTIPALTITSSYTGTGFVDTDVLALKAPVATTAAVKVFTDTQTLLLSSTVTSTDTSKYATVAGVKYPKLGGQVTYKAILINAGTPILANESLSIAVTSPAADVAYPATITSCSTGSAVTNLPSPLAANTALVCTFTVTVTTYHVTAQQLPSVTVQAKKGSTSLGSSEQLVGLPIYTEPSLTVSHTLARGTADPLDLGAGVRLATAGTLITYNVTFTNGYVAVPETASFTVTVAGIPGATATCTPSIPNTSGIASKEVVICTFSCTVSDADKNAGYSPDITVNARLTTTSGSVSSTTIAATASYPTIPVLKAGPQLFVQNAATKGSSTVDGKVLANMDGQITYTVTLVNGATAVAAANNLAIAITSADANFPTALSSTCTPELPLAVDTSLAAGAQLSCTFVVNVTAAHFAASRPGVAPFNVSAVKGAVTMASSQVPLTHINSPATLNYLMTVASFEPVNGTKMPKDTSSIEYTVTLVNGARAKPSTSEYSFTTNSSIFTTFTSCTSLDAKVSYPTAKVNGLAAFEGLTCKAQHTVNAQDIAAGSIAPFTIQAVEKDTNSYAPSQASYANAANVPYLELFTGLPCISCRGCLAQMFGFVQQQNLLAETDATRIATLFNTLCRTNRDTNKCTDVMNAIQNSANGNVGKRAGLICSMLGECEPHRFEATCNIGSASPVIPNGDLDLCKPEGTKPAETTIPGVEAAGVNVTEKMQGYCYSPDTQAGAAYCPVGKECSFNKAGATALKRCFCNSTTGLDTCEEYYTCIDTPCTKCTTCMSGMRAFTNKATIQNEIFAQTVADAFKSYCLGLGVSMDTCIDIAVDISTSYQGSLGKRPAWLCQKIGGCPSGITTLPADCTITPNRTATEDNLTKENFGLCSIDGWKLGAGVPGIYPNNTQPSWVCSDARPCNATNNEVCTFASNKQFCTCPETGNGEDDCSDIGECVAINCPTCNSCLRKTSAWIASRTTVTNASALATAWSTHCNTLGVTTFGLCESVKTAILSSYNGNIAKRAGNLCSRLNLCSPAASCNLNTTSTNLTVTAPMTGLLDMCTMEGVAGANYIPGVLTDSVAVSSFSSRFPNVTYQCSYQDQGCPTDYQCDITSVKGAICRCEGTDAGFVPAGSDTCTEYYDCVRTPCKVCSDCLADMTTFANKNLYTLDRPTLGDAFNSTCIGKGYPIASCSAVAAKIKIPTTPVAFGKRAGALCSALAACNPTDLPTDCSLKPNDTFSGNPSTFDLCKVQGLDSGDNAPGTTDSLTELPADRCDNDADCSSTEKLCSKIPNFTAASFCNCYKGQDTCRDLGTCIKKPCPACSDCMSDFQAFVTAAPAVTSVSGLETAFVANCTGSLRKSAVCQSAGLAIANSYNGNAGRKASSICQLLGECNTTAMGTCNMTVGTLTGQYSMCTQQGVSTGHALNGSPVNTTYTLADGQCVSSADCDAASGYECRMRLPNQPLLPPVCYCDAGSGRDICTPVGECLLTACQQCQNCLAAVNPVIVKELNSTSQNRAAACTAAAQIPAEETICSSMASKYFTAQAGSTGNFGLRAAAVCSALGKCTQPGCQLRAEVAGVNRTATLDLCTAEGIVGGTPIAQGKPEGACLTDAECSTEMQCDRSNTTNTVNKCAGGVDTITQYGACVAKPPSRADLPACTRCGQCISTLRPSAEAAALNTTALRSFLGASFYAACSGAQYSLTACRDVQTLIETSVAGNLARRVGALCLRLGECTAALSTDSSCTLVANATNAAVQILVQPATVAVSNDTNTTVSTNDTTTTPPEPTVTQLSGRLDSCTIEGVSSGGMVLGTFKYSQVFNNTCVLDSDCASGMLCSSSSTIKVCRCSNGIDSCDILNTCKAPAVVAPVVQKTPCQRCGDCLSNVAAFVTKVAAATDAKAEAAAFMGLCTSNFTSNNVVACKPVADAIFYDIRMAKRGGLLCQRLGECSADLAATSSACNITVGSKAGRLNLCEKEGVGISAATAAAVYNSTNCRTDADCKDNTTYVGQVCSLDGASIKLTTSCSNGVDTTVKTGSCVGFCTTQDAYVTALNEQVEAISCSGPYADCGVGRSCKSSALCQMLECEDDMKGVTTTPCYGFCMAADRSVLSAKMSNNGKVITAALNTPAAPGAFPCAAVFDGPTMDKLGYDAGCDTKSENGKALTITLGPQSAFNPDVDTLTVAATQKALVDILDVSATGRFTGSAIAVAKCAPTYCTGATAVVFGPKFVPEPCDATTAADVIFDASFSSDQSGRPLSRVVWQLTAGGPDIVMSAAIEKANLANNGNGAFRMVISGSQITSMVGTDPYTVTVTVSNFLGAVSTATWSFTKKALGATPIVTLPSGNAVSFKIADGVKVPLALAAASVCSDKKVVYSWASAVAWDAIPSGYSKKDLVISGPVAGIAAGESRNVTVTAKFQDAAASDATTTVVTLTALASPLRANLKGPQGDVKSDRNIVLSAVGSRDPDDPQATKPLAVTWKCVRADFPVPCFTGANAGTQDGLTWTIPAGLLKADVQHTIVANITRTFTNGTADASEFASAQVSFTPRAAAIPTGRVRRVCSGPCPPNHSADSALMVTMAPDAGSESATVAWSSEQVPTAGTVTGRDWVIPTSLLPKTGAVTINAVLASGAATSTTTAVITINGKPTCTKDSGCIAVDAATGVFPTAKFTAEAVGFVDDQPGLRFDFGTLGAYDTRVVVASGTSPTYTFTGLPVGESGLYVCAVDMDGAKACSQTKVTVTAPAAADFKVADALTGFDIDHLVGTGDMSVLASGAQALQSLSTFASKSDVAATQTAEEQEQVQKTIAAKTSSMIGTLASKSSDYIKDPETMSQVVSAVATLTKATTQLSKDTKDKMLDVANSGIAAAKLSAKPLSPAEASRLWAVVAAGNDLKASCKVPGSCAQAASVARRLLQELLNVDTIYSRSLLESASVTVPTTSHRNLLATDVTPSTDTVVANTSADTTTTTSTSTTTATTSNAFVPSFAAQAGEVGDLLSQGAGPAAYLSGGDNGLYLSTANFLGRNYDLWSVVAGPALDESGNQADPASGENAQLKFSKDLVSTCVDEEGTVLGSGTCGDVVVPVRLSYLPDAASLLAPAATSARKLQQVDGHTVVSGAAVVDVSGNTESAFPCDGCTAVVSIPIWEQKQDWMLYECGRIVDGVITYDAADATSSGVQSVGTPAVPTVTCTVNKAGSYIIGKRADPSRPAGTPETDPAVEALVLGQPLKFNFKLEVDETVFGSINDFLKDAARVDAFVQSVKSELVTSFAASNMGTGVTKDSIQVLNIHKGSIDFDVVIDTSGITDAAALKALATYIKSATSPSDLFSSSFISTYSVTGMTVTLAQYTAPASVLPVAAIVGGVVGGVGGALLVAATAFFVIRRRKMGGVEPRGTANRNLLNGDHSA